ncbi:hypothetical protein NX872_21110 [Burkholderia thailandensis]|uniref:hypothetical protein n=1 Tax=Burkholderia thailandensis TaxID=57975 RepID=UPI000CAF56C5|nr:hypothetical protein [Burkholderia thailandensis]MCS6490758.1 hypothetical protein [Burkholderia thailandensis]MCS6518134.1 hypothetical protein [Burkholderia thailandensis]PJO72431.1 hypothetical protein CWD92_09050 [Burkholderia thailandensis]
MSKELTSMEIEWTKAVIQFTHEGESGPLVELLRGPNPIPVSARQFIACIISGELVLADQRGRSNAKLHWKAKKQITDGLGHVYENSEIVLCFIDELADKFRIEPIDIRQKMEKARRDAIRTVAARYDMSESGIRKMVNLSAAAAFGRMLSGADASGWEGGPMEVGAQLIGEEHAEAVFALAERILRDADTILDPLLPKDPLTE